MKETARYLRAALFVGLLGCTTPHRVPSSASESFKESLQAKLALVVDSKLDPATCKNEISVFKEDLKHIPWSAYSNQELKAEGVAAIKSIWDARAKLHAKLESLSSECIYAMREAFHSMRDVEDYIGEFAYNVPVINPESLKFQEQPVPILDRKAYSEYYVSPNVDADNFKFQAGDLIVVRGISFVSAIISQVSDNQSQFSHVIFVNVDPNTQKPNTVEAYIGAGMASYEINFAMKNENARLLVIRPKNKALGAKAAEIMTKRIYGVEKLGKPVPYDYWMDFKDHSKMSCAEVATASYEWASGSKVILPKYPANISMKNDRFLSQIGLKRGPIFTPGDLEVDPNFEIVADWRDTRLIRDSRYKDAILSEMMRWVGTLNYQFNDSLKSLFAKYVILPSRKTPLWGLVKRATGAPALDKEIPKKALGLMTAVSQIGDGLLDNLEKADKEYIAKNGRPMTNDQLREYLETVRIKDREDFIARRKNIMHYVLRPDDLKQKSIFSIR